MPERDFKLPDLGEGLEDAEVVRWLVGEGEVVELNQPLIEVDTAKALVEIPSPFAGKVLRLHAGEGDTVNVGASLVTFEVSEEEVKRQAVLVGYGVDEEKTHRRRRLTSRPQRQNTDAATADAQPTQQTSVLAPPPVRKLAAELGVDLSEIVGSGPGGRVTREDVLESSKAVQLGTESKAEGPTERVPVKGVRKLIAEKMVRSVSEIPHVTTYLTFNASRVLELRDESSAVSGSRVTPLAVISKAFLEICKGHPKLNASWDATVGEIVLKRYYNLGIATDTERGLIVPVIRDADQLGLVDLAAEILRVSTAARDGKATIEDLSGGTVTVSNVGSFGAEFGTPIINLPESSILAVGLIEQRAGVIDGSLSVLPLCTLSLSFDHRIADGAEAGRALLDLKKLLEDGDQLARI